jgi:hypothetical protein
VIGCTKSISNILIWEVKYASPCDISNDSNFPDKIDTKTVECNSCLRERINPDFLVVCFCIKRNPSKSTAPTESLDKRCPWVIENPCPRTYRRTREDNPASIFTPGTSMNQTCLIGIAQNIRRARYLGSTEWTPKTVLLVKCRPSHISEPKKSREVSIFISSSGIS